MQVIEDFETFPEITNTPPSDQRFRVMITKSWGRSLFWIDQTIWTSLDFKPTSKRILGEPQVLEIFITFLTEVRT
jgi:hypothetical protein